MREEFGDIAIQSTRPQTLGAALVDSPVGQLAWIVDKFREWTHPRTTLPDEVIDRDRLLTNVMIYWLNGAAGPAAYIGYAQETRWGMVNEPRQLPLVVGPRNAWRAIADLAPFYRFSQRPANSPECGAGPGSGRCAAGARRASSSSVR